MDVTCERCQTRYAFDAALVADRGTTVKCNNCGHVFRIFGDSDSAPTAVRAAVAAEPEPSFSDLPPTLVRPQLPESTTAKAPTEGQEVSETAETVRRDTGFSEAALQTHRDTPDLFPQADDGELTGRLPPLGLKPRTKPLLRIAGAVVVVAILGSAAGLWWKQQTRQQKFETHLKQARTSMNRDHIASYQDAIQDFAAARKIRPYAIEPRIGLAVAYALWAQALRFEIMDTHAAKRQAERARSRPRTAALNREQARKSSQALEFAQAAVRVDGRSSDALLALADARRLSGALDDAASALERSLQLSGEPTADHFRVRALLRADADPHDGMGRAYIDSRRAVEADPESTRSRLLLARVLLHKADVSQARAHLNAVLERFPKHPNATRLSHALDTGSSIVGPIVTQVPSPTEDGDPKTGASTEKSKPTSETAAANLALEQGNLDEAEKGFRKALATNPEDGGALAGLGHIELERGDFRTAADFFEQAAKSGHPEAWLGLGDANRELGRTTDAADAYRAYLREKPDGPGARVAQMQMAKLKRSHRERPSSVARGSAPPERSPPKAPSGNNEKSAVERNPYE